VPFGMFHAGHVPGDRPKKGWLYRGGYIAESAIESKWSI
jgi:hypothetical protein